ncbi:MAG: sensor histidine kinase [Acutalibacteraceae bacterium]
MALSNLFIVYPHAQIANFVTILIVLSMIVSFISFFLLISKNMKSIHYQSVNKLVEQNIEEQVNYYNRLSQYNDDLRKFKHDYENLKIGLLAQLNEGNIDEAVKFLNDCSSMISNSDVLYHSGNPVIDSLLFDKANQVKDSNITINFNGLFPQNPMNTADLCAVFGNIIDNAIEACLKLPKDENKNIEIFLSQKHDYIFITFINPVLNTVEIKNNTVATTKDNKDEHGIGLYSVRKILKKYDGHLSLISDNKVFTTKIDFRIAQ